MGEKRERNGRENLKDGCGTNARLREKTRAIWGKEKREQKRQKKTG